jgi:hypothetical protein
MDRKERLSAYRAILEEIKSRFSVLGAILTRAQANQCAFSPEIDGELAYLQLRLICELIALACLMMHGDIEDTQTSKIQNRYEADWILKVLGKLHPEFYPKPVSVSVTADGVIEAHEIKEFLTRDNLEKLYYRCAEILHRGSLKSIFNDESRKIDMNEIYGAYEMIKALLNYHFISLIEPTHIVLVAMMDGATKAVGTRELRHDGSDRPRFVPVDH